MMTKSNADALFISDLIQLCKYTRTIQRKGVKALIKPDKTLVSQVDLFVQAAVIHHLASYSPNTEILAEETAAQVRQDPNLAKSLNHHLCQLQISQDAVALISQGTHMPSGLDYWCLDPIDGTRGFLRGDHYAIALAFVRGDAIIESFLGCPNLLGHGVLFRVKNSTARAYNIDTGAEISITDRFDDERPPYLIESLELGPSTETLTKHLKKNLGWSTESLRMDSQSKYGAMALRMAHCYLRLPRTTSAKEYAWDHAAGSHLIQTLGGKVTDLDGRALDFSQGATLTNNRGIIATIDLRHSQVVEQFQKTEQDFL